MEGRENKFTRVRESKIKTNHKQ